MTKGSSVTPHLDELTHKIIGAAIEVHRHLGPGLLESVYERCTCYEIGQLGLKYESQKSLPLVYKGLTFDQGYRIDILVEGLVVVELKCVEQLTDVHEAQILTYLRTLRLQSRAAAKLQRESPQRRRNSQICSLARRLLYKGQNKAPCLSVYSLCGSPCY